MPARNIHALIYGQTGSGVTTLIKRWVSGRLPTSMEELALPYNGVKNINIQLAGQKTSEVAMVTLVDGGVFRGDEEGLRRICGKVDVIVACTCVQVDDTGLPGIQHINKLLGARRPPVIVLGTMSDLRDEASDTLPLLTAIACSNDVEKPQEVMEEMGKGSRDAPSSGYPELSEEPRRVGQHRNGKKPGPDQTPSVTSEHSIDVEVFEEQTPLLLVSTRHGRQDQSIERNSTKEQDVPEGETHSLMPGQFQVTVNIENPHLQKVDIGGSKALEQGVPETNEKVHFSEKDSFPIMPESDDNEETSVILNESSLSSKLELTIENLKRHSIKNDDPGPEICSIEDDCSAAQERLLLSDGEASDVTGSDRRMASPTDLEFDNIEHDLSFLSRELMNISSHRMNPHYWSTESINGSVGSYLDRSRDEISVPGPAHNRPLRQKKHAADLAPCSTQPLHQLDRSSSSHKDVIGDEVNHSSKSNTSPIKPLLETHFPASSDSSFTVKYFPCTQNSNATISSSTDCSQTSLHNNNSWTDNTGKSGKCDDCIANGAESTSTTSALRHGEVSTSSSSSLPEVKNLHISLDLAPVKLIGPYPGKALLRGVNSGWFLSMEDGTRCVKNLRGERYMECSALSGDNLHQVFEYMVRAGCKYNRRRNAKCLIS
ncbi:uncharacterized protein LOC124258618 [Haliotis rubra]|uniref:uncharacterized protein LOC124258618 n=1 Tax=Haliotis rubra TaxID=36100 RepID=UPI001EE63172|nr:uncharacterized protein LOC124258618 [Haliotis rubra]XP_046548642.1 uncharacterized protein LOC124258618 [Haliotis rubra]